MDPESLAELEQAVKNLSSIMGNAASAMSDAMRDFSRTTAQSEGTLKTSTEDLGKVMREAESARRDLTRAEKQAAEAESEKSKLLGKVNNALSASVGAISAFGGALLSGQQGLSKYNTAIQKSTDSIELLGVALGGMWKWVGLIIGVFGRLVQDANKVVDQTVSYRNAMTETIGASSASLGELNKLASNARFTGDNMATLAKATAGLGSDLAALGGIAGQGGTTFLKMADVGDTVRKRFEMMGYSQEKLLDMQAKYVQIQAQSGNAYQLQRMSQAELTAKSIEYSENLAKLSTLTGLNAEDIQKRRLAVETTRQEQLMRINENAQIAAAGGENTAAGRAIKARQTARIELEDKLSPLVGQQTALAIAQMARQPGAIGPQAAGAVFNASQAGYNLPALVQRASRPEATEQDINAVADAIKGGIVKQSQLGIVNEFSSDEGLNARGLYEEDVIQASRRLGISLDALDKQAAATMKAREDQADKDNKLASDLADLHNRELALQAAYNDALFKTVNAIGPTGLLAAMGVLTGAAYAASAALASIALGGFLNFIKGSGGVGGLGNALNILKGGGKAAGAAEGAAEGAEGGAAAAEGGAAAAEGVGAAGEAVTLGGLVAEGAEAGGAVGAGVTAPVAEGGGLGPLAGAGIGALVGAAGYGLYKLLGSKNKNRSVMDNYPDNMPDINNPANPSNRLGDLIDTLFKTNNLLQELIRKLGTSSATSATPAFSSTTGVEAPPAPPKADTTTSPNSTADGSTPWKGPADVGAALQTIKEMEGGRYDIQHPMGLPGTASGAYGITDPAWASWSKKYNIGREYTHAGNAPPNVQDALAGAAVQDILNKNHGDMSMVPIVWYTGNPAGKISAKALAANRGQNPQTYQQRWLKHYMKHAPKASGGGLFDGPDGGYPVELHGGEMVAPLDTNSILMKLAKTPASNSSEITTTTNVLNTVDSSMKQVMNSHNQTMSMLSRKLDSMISVLESTHSVQKQTQRYIMA